MDSLFSYCCCCFSIKQKKIQSNAHSFIIYLSLIFMTGGYLENMTMTSPPVSTGVNTRKHRVRSTQQKAFTQFLLQFTPLLTELYMSVQDTTGAAPTSKVLPGTHPPLLSRWHTGLNDIKVLQRASSQQILQKARVCMVNTGLELALWQQVLPHSHNNLKLFPVLLTWCWHFYYKGTLCVEKEAADGNRTPIH